MICFIKVWLTSVVHCASQVVAITAIEYVISDTKKTPSVQEAFHKSLSNTYHWHVTDDTRTTMIYHRTQLESPQLLDKCKFQTTTVWADCIWHDERWSSMNDSKQSRMCLASLVALHRRSSHGRTARMDGRSRLSLNCIRTNITTIKPHTYSPLPFWPHTTQ